MVVSACTLTYNGMSFLEGDVAREGMITGYLYPPSSTSKDVVFIAYPPPYPAVKYDNKIQTSIYI